MLEPEDEYVPSDSPRVTLVAPDISKLWMDALIGPSHIVPMGVPLYRGELGSINDGFKIVESKLPDWRIK